MDKPETDLDAIQEQIEHGDTDNDQLLSFVLGNEEYGVDILRVQEIKGWEKTTQIPNTPEFVMGAINLRGAVVPIVDLRLRFGLHDVTYDDTTVVIILRAEDNQDSQKIIGLVVDGVSDVYSLQSQDLQVAPDMGGTVHSDYVRGLATLGDKMVIVLHVDHLINQGILTSIKKVMDIE